MSLSLQPTARREPPGALWRAVRPASSGVLARVVWRAPPCRTMKHTAGTVVSTGASATIIDTETQFHTGHAYGGQRSRSRARHCARSGFPGHTADLVADGFLQGGFHVLPEHFEPEDSYNIVELPDTEGEIDDKNTGAS